MSRSCAHDARAAKTAIDQVCKRRARVQITGGILVRTFIFQTLFERQKYALKQHKLPASNSKWKSNVCEF